MNNLNNSPKIFSLKESQRISLFSKIIAAAIIIFAILTQNGVAIVCIFVIAIPLLLMAISIKTSDENQTEKQLIKNELKKALDETAFPVHDKNPPTKYLFSKPTLYILALLVTIFGVYSLASGDSLSASFFLVSVALANHAHQRD